MELTLLLRALTRFWWLIVIPVVVAAALTLPDLAGSQALPPLYTTVVRYSAAQQLDAIPDRDGDYQDVWLASELTVNALTAWVQTSSFAQAVAEEAAARGVPIDSAASGLGIAADNERSIGQLFLSWRSAEELETIAAAAFTVLQERSQEVFPQLGGQPARVTILDEPRVTAVPPPLTNRFTPLLRLGLALAAGIGLALLAYYLDPVLRRRDEVEAAGLPVVASIPKR